MISGLFAPWPDSPHYSLSSDHNRKTEGLSDLGYGENPNTGDGNRDSETGKQSEERGLAQSSIVKSSLHLRP